MRDFIYTVPGVFPEFRGRFGPAQPVEKYRLEFGRMKRDDDSDLVGIFFDPAWRISAANNPRADNDGFQERAMGRILTLGEMSGTFPAGPEINGRPTISMDRNGAALSAEDIAAYGTGLNPRAFTLMFVSRSWRASWTNTIFGQSTTASASGGLLYINSAGVLGTQVGGSPATTDSAHDYTSSTPVLTTLYFSETLGNAIARNGAIIGANPNARTPLIDGAAPILGRPGGTSTQNTGQGVMGRWILFTDDLRKPQYADDLAYAQEFFADEYAISLT